MLLKYNVQINSNIIVQRFQSLINQVYKLLPIREENLDWKKPLQTIMEELAGMQRLLNCGDSENYLTLLNKLEGLYLLQSNDSFKNYRRTIFECLNLMNTLKKDLCLQNC